MKGVYWDMGINQHAHFIDGTTESLMSDNTIIISTHFYFHFHFIFYLMLLDIYHNSVFF